MSKYKMNLLEGMTTIVMKKDFMERKEREREMNLLFVLFFVKIISIAIVSYFLWPNIVPKIFPSVTADPGFLNLFGLSIIINLLL